MGFLNKLFLSIVSSTIVFDSSSFGYSILEESSNFSASDAFSNNSNNSVLYKGKQPTKDCLNNYSTECIALSMTKLLTRLEQGSTLQLLPGVLLVWPSQQEAVKTWPLKNVSADVLYFGKLADYLSSMSLRIQLFHPKTLSYMNSIQEKISNAVQTSEARKKMKDSAGIIGLGFMFGVSLLLMALTGLGVLAGKAVMTGVIAFFFSAMTGLSMLKGDEKSTYEVVSRPVVSHGHSHSSEIQYEQASPHGHHAYKRSLSSPYVDENSDQQLAYKIYRRKF